jgi:hypothetical protein
LDTFWKVRGAEWLAGAEQHVLALQMDRFEVQLKSRENGWRQEPE